MRSFKIDLHSISRVKFAVGAALVVGLVTVSSFAPAALGQKKKSGSETGLVGVTLYDDGVKIISKFGSPDEIEAVSVGGTTSAGGGGKGAPGSGGFGPTGGNAPRGGPAPAGAPGPSSAPGNGASGADFTGPIDPAFDFANDLLGQGPARPAGPGPMGRPGGGPPGIPGGGPSGPGGAGPAGGAAGQDTRTLFTRWIYKRNGSKYGFVFDKFNRVVQIEAVGLSNPKVFTKRGIHFGAPFGTIIKKYAKNPDGSANQPDGYEISGSTVVVRYLVKNKVAFKLSRLGKDKPYVVTGIVVAAGKL